MNQPLQLVFRHMDSSPALEKNIREQLASLETHGEPIVSCQVIVEQRHRHHHQGNHFHVRLSVQVAGRELVASRDPDAPHKHENVYVAVHDAVEVMRRQLQDYTQRRREGVKVLDQPVG
ncbi:MAG: ribosome-associated translation inhibitor RaiA [Gammaproteobacteria bacterium]|nr:ribosome-associated translation inhibitor RaiA [Gammaproteobacteria bacterium]